MQLAFGVCYYYLNTSTTVFVPAIPDLLIDPVLHDQFHLLLYHPGSKPDPDLDFKQVKERLDCFKIRIRPGKSTGLFDVDHHQFVKMGKFPGYIDDLFERHPGENFLRTIRSPFFWVTLL